MASTDLESCVAALSEGAVSYPRGTPVSAGSDRGSGVPSQAQRMKVLNRQPTRPNPLHCRDALVDRPRAIWV